MKPETAEAFARLVTTYVTVIESTGSVLPADIEQRLAESPLKACELLNELALSSDALDRDTDAIVAAIYESMDAADARGPVDEATRALVARAYARAHREPPAPEPEPEPVEEFDAEATPVEATAENEEKPARGRRGRRSKHDAEDASEPAANGQDARQDAEEPEKPRKRRGRKPKREQAQDEPQLALDEATDESESDKAAGDASADDPAPKPRPGRGRRAKAHEGQTSVASEATPAAAPAAPESATDATQTSSQDKTASEATDSHARAEAEPAAPLAKNAEVLTVDQTLAALGVSRPTVYKLIESGRLPAYKKGRSWQISAAAVAELANK